MGLAPRPTPASRVMAVDDATRASPWAARQEGVTAGVGPEGAVAAVVAANADVPDARLRLTITSGPGPLGSPRGSEGRTVLAAVAPIPPLKPSYAIAVSPWARNERGALAGLKTVSYAENAMVLAWARDRGCDEAVVPNLAGNLCEGTGTNV